MAYGIQLTNSSGSAVVKEGDIVPVFHGKYVVSQAVRSTDYYINTSIPSTESLCLLYVRGDVFMEAGGGVVKLNGYYQIKHRGGYGTLYVFKAPSTSYDVNKYGVRIYNQNGSLAYQNSVKHLKIVTISPTYGQVFSYNVAIQRVIIGGHVFTAPWATNGQATYKRALAITDATSAARLGVAQNTVAWANIPPIPSPVKIGTRSGVIPVIDVSAL